MWRNAELRVFSVGRVVGVGDNSPYGCELGPIWVAYSIVRKCRLEPEADEMDNVLHTQFA